MEKKRSVHLILVGILIIAMMPASAVFGQGDEEISFAREQALRLIENLSPTEKVGQLFLLTFDGTDTAARLSCEDNPYFSSTGYFFVI